jgi:divalent metal cation (Fe/Co/Zn/Cd) transporter
VLTRILDGVEPGIIDAIHHAAEHVSGVHRVLDAKARWLGHKLHAEVSIAVDENLPVASAREISASLQRELREHVPALAEANVRFGVAREAVAPDAHGHPDR